MHGLHLNGGILSKQGGHSGENTVHILALNILLQPKSKPALSCEILQRYCKQRAATKKRKHFIALAVITHPNCSYTSAKERTDRIINSVIFVLIMFKLTSASDSRS